MNVNVTGSSARLLGASAIDLPALAAAAVTAEGMDPAVGRGDRERAEVLVRHRHRRTRGWGLVPRRRA